MAACVIDPAKHRLMINGLVDTPLVFTMEDLMRFPRENRVYFLECAANSGMEWRGAQLNGCQFTHGMIHNVVYTGVPLRYLLEEAGVKTNGKWVCRRCRRLGDDRSIPMEKALDDCLVAFKMNGEALRPEQGYPVRLVVPGWEGNMWVKWLRRLEVGDEPWHHREETSKYTDLLADGKARRFTWEMDANRSSPARARRRRSPMEGADWSSPAWPGPAAAHHACRRDARRRHELAEARFDGPSLDKALHRFYSSSTGTARPLLLQSRAIDETGYVQPTKNELREGAWRELDLSQQRHPDLARQTTTGWLKMLKFPKAVRRDDQGHQDGLCRPEEG
jgi:sulfane dehydrogenase subunit SoxC